MNTPTHVLIAEAVFKRTDVAYSGWAAAVGAILPDAFLGVFVGWALTQRLPQQQIWDVEYFKQPWQTIGAISNSFVLWGLALGIGIAGGRAVSEKVATFGRLLTIAAFSGLSHLVSDFLTHADDAHMHFWPLSETRFISPVSYWDNNHHARWIMPIEALLIFGSVFILWRQASSTKLKALLGVMVVLGCLLIG